MIFASVVAKLLLNKKTAARLGALRTLSEWRTEAAFDLVRGRLSDDEVVVRAEAVACVGPFGTDAAYREVAPLLKDPSLAVRVEAIAVLSYMPLDLVRTNVYEALKDRDAGIRIEAASQLARFKNDPETRIRMHALLRDEIPAVREAAAFAMSQVGDPRSLKAAVEHLRTEENESVRRELYEAMVSVDPKGAIPHLIDLMNFGGHLLYTIKEDPEGPSGEDSLQSPEYRKGEILWSIDACPYHLSLLLFARVKSCRPCVRRTQIQPRDCYAAAGIGRSLRNENRPQPRSIGSS